MRTSLMRALPLLIAALTPVLLSSQVSTSERAQFGLAVNSAADGDFERAFELARDIGLEVVELPLAWDEHEPRRDRYDGELLDIANAFYGAHGVGMVLSPGPIDTNNLRLPRYLRHRRFDQPAFINRYKRWLDFVFSRLPDVDIRYLAVGNEVDSFLGTDARQWRRYRTFVEAIVEYVHRRWPGVAVGVKGTWGGMTDSYPGEFLLLNQFSDVVMTTYYPLDADYRVRPPGGVRADLRRVVDLYPGQRIVLAEAGCPSGRDNGSSRGTQRHFVRRLFQAWDAFAESIEMVMVVWMHDIPVSEVEQLVGYYGLDDPGFASFLGTLGLRTHAGSDKPAFIQLRRELERRRLTSSSSDE